MSWVRFDDRFYNNRKVMSVSVAARWLYVSGLCVANQHSTDGLLDAVAQECLLVAVGRSGNFDALAAELVWAGLWIQAGSSFEIHDYLEYQLSADEQRKERAASAERQKNFRERRRSVVTPPITPLQTPLSTPSKTVPRPVPSRPDLSRPDPAKKDKGEEVAGTPPASPPTQGELPEISGNPQGLPSAIVKSRAEVSPVSLCWQAYSNAYAKRYGALPVPSARVNSQLAQLVKDIGKVNAVLVAEFYPTHCGSFYVSRGHAVGIMVSDAQKLLTEARTGRNVNAETARQEERTAANPGLQYLEELRRTKDGKK